MIGKLHFVSTITTVLILDMIIGQRDREISPV